MSRLGNSHLRDSTVVLLWLHNLTAVVFQIEEHNHFAHPVVFCGALSDCLLKVPIPPQYLQDITADVCQRPVLVASRTIYDTVLPGHVYVPILTVRRLVRRQRLGS